MKLILKNLRQVQYNVEIESEKKTIKDLKNEIEKLHGFDSNLIKLLHNGKVLEDSKTLEEYQIKEENVIVMMNTKPKTKTKTQTIEEVKPPSPKKEKPKKEEEIPNNDPALVNQLIEMGYEAEKAEKALSAANGDMQLAIEFLSSGNIPKTSIHNQLSQYQSQSNNSESEIKYLASLIKVICHEQPEKINDILDRLLQNNPSVIQLLREKEEEFKSLLVAPINQEDINVAKSLQEDLRDGGGRKEIRINLTPEEREAINRLKNLGDFTERDILQAYIACDKNEELAANYLFEQKLRDEEEEQNKNQGQ